MSTAISPALGPGGGGDPRPSVGQARLIRRAHKVGVDVSGVGQELCVSIEGVDCGHRLDVLGWALLTGLGGVGQYSLSVSLQQLLLLLLFVTLDFSYQRVPLAFGHAAKLHRWTQQKGSMVTCLLNSDVM